MLISQKKLAGIILHVCKTEICFKFLYVLLLPFVLRQNCNCLDCVHYPRQVVLSFSYNHNSEYNKILKSDWLSTVLISALIGQCNRTIVYVMSK